MTTPADTLRASCITAQASYKPGDPAPEGYLAWHEWATVQVKAGLRQKQCGGCGLWRFPQEMSERTVSGRCFTAQWKVKNWKASLCLRCEAKP